MRAAAAPSARRAFLQHAHALHTAHTAHGSRSALLSRCLLFAAKIQNDLRILTERLARINDNLARKITSRNEYDKTIQETEAAYSKVRARRCHYRWPAAARASVLTSSPVCVAQIMESSQTLLHVLKRESVNLTKKKQASS